MDLGDDPVDFVALVVKGCGLGWRELVEVGGDGGDAVAEGLGEAGLGRRQASGGEEDEGIVVGKGSSLQ